MKSEEKRRKTSLSLCAKTYTKQPSLIIETVKLFFCCGLVKPGFKNCLIVAIVK